MTGLPAMLLRGRSTLFLLVVLRTQRKPIGFRIGLISFNYLISFEIFRQTFQHGNRPLMRGVREWKQAFLSLRCFQSFCQMKF